MSAALGLLCGELCRLPKRLCRLLPLLLLLCAASLAALYAVSTGAAQKEGALRLALVNGDDSFLGRTAVAAIAGNEAVSALFTVENCDEETALAGLQSGRYAAAMLFADDFFYGILDGDGNAVRIVLPDALQRNGALVAHAAATGETLMRTAESAVNAAWQPLIDTLPAADAARAIEKLELTCAVEFLTLPTAAFAEETLPYSAAGLSLYAHYAVCFTVLLFFLCEALFAADIRESCSYAVFCRLRGLGVTNGAFLLCKCAVPFFCRALLLCGIGAVAARAGLPHLSAGAVCAALAALLLLTLFLTALSAAASQAPLGAALPGDAVQKALFWSMLSLLSIAFCPIFFDLPALLGFAWVKFLLPPSFFAFAEAGGIFPAAVALAVWLLGLGCCARINPYKLKKTECC